MDHHLWLPNVKGNASVEGQDNACGMDDSENGLANLWLLAQVDRRDQLSCDGRLVRVARSHAQYLESQRTPTYTPPLHVGAGGSTPNQRARAGGYDLPDWYGDGNNIESCYMANEETNNAVDMIATLLSSPSHRAHLMGEGGFSYNVVYGFGHYGYFWVCLVSAPGET